MKKLILVLIVAFFALNVSSQSHTYYSFTFNTVNSYGTILSSYPVYERLVVSNKGNSRYGLFIGGEGMSDFNDNTNNLKYYKMMYEGGTSWYVYNNPLYGENILISCDKKLSSVAAYGGDCTFLIAVAYSENAWFIQVTQR